MGAPVRHGAKTESPTKQNPGSRFSGCYGAEDKAARWLPGEPPCASPGLTRSSIVLKQEPEVAERATCTERFRSVTKESHVGRVRNAPRGCCGPARMLSVSPDFWISGTARPWKGTRHFWGAGDTVGPLRQGHRQGAPRGKADGPRLQQQGLCGALSSAHGPSSGSATCSTVGLTWVSIFTGRA